VGVKASLPSFGHSLDLGLLRSFCLSKQAWHVRSMGSLHGNGASVTSCSGVGSVATFATNRRHGKRSALELILSMLLGVVLGVIGTMPNI
jgi:hypothetical protein